MAPIHSSDKSNSRRRFLTLFGAAAATATAGCTGGADEPDDGGGATDGPDEPNPGGGADGTGEPDGTAEPEGNGGVDDGGQAIGSCDDLRGAATPLEPGDRQFPLLFEYPDTFEEYNVGILESESIVGSLLGHIGSAESASYPVNVVVHQHKGATTDEEAAENWAMNFGNGEQIDWQFTYDGEEVPIYDALPGDEETSTWQFMMPAHETEGFRGVSVQFQDNRSEFACHDVLTEIAKKLIESLTPNPDWQ